MNKNLREEYNDFKNILNKIYDTEIFSRYLIKPDELIINNNDLENIINNNYFYIASDYTKEKNFHNPATQLCRHWLSIIIIKIHL